MKKKLITILGVSSIILLILGCFIAIAADDEEIKKGLREMGFPEDEIDDFYGDSESGGGSSSSSDSGDCCGSSAVIILICCSVFVVYYGKKREMKGK